MPRCKSVAAVGAVPSHGWCLPSKAQEELMTMQPRPSFSALRYRQTARPGMDGRRLGVSQDHGWKMPTQSGQVATVHTNVLPPHSLSPNAATPHKLALPKFLSPHLKT